MVWMRVSVARGGWPGRARVKRTAWGSAGCSLSWGRGHAVCGVSLVNTAISNAKRPAYSRLVTGALVYGPEQGAASLTAVDVYLDGMYKWDADDEEDDQ